MAALIAAIAPLGIAGEGKDEGARAASGHIALRHQRRKRLSASARLPLIARLSARRRRASSASGPPRADAIIGLRIRLPAKKIVSEAAVATDGCERRAKLLRASEIGQRRLRFAIDDRNRAHAGLRQRAARVDLVGAGEEAGSRLRVTQAPARRGRRRSASRNPWDRTQACARSGRAPRTPFHCKANSCPARVQGAADTTAAPAHASMRPSQS